MAAEGGDSGQGVICPSFWGRGDFSVFIFLDGFATVGDDSGVFNFLLFTCLAAVVSLLTPMGVNDSPVLLSLFKDTFFGCAISICSFSFCS